MSEAAKDVREEILRTCGLLIQPGDVHEVRIPKAGRGGTISGYFDDPEKLTNAILVYDGRVPGVYSTLNPVKPALLARAANRLREHADVTTSDADILRRRWLLIDLDPRRPTGISSSDYEHGRAITCGYGVWDDLRSEFGNPVLSDSGNGCHLAYPVDLPNDAASTDLVSRILAGVAARCVPDDIECDLSVSNAGRIVKLWGTKACKGDDIPSRPHRRSRVLEVPEDLHVLKAVGKLNGT